MTKKSVIKIGILIAIIVMISFSDWTFAADGDSESLNEKAELLNAILSILSWIWVWFAKGAGEFLTNKRVYGELLGLDAILWKWRNIMKNMANFGLGFYFVYLILRELVGNMTGGVTGGSATKSIKDQILWILIAGIGIQASRFMTAVVIDVSTVTLVAAGSLPSQVISEFPELEKDFGVAMGDYLEVQVTDERNLGDIINGVRYSLFSPNEKNKSFVTEIRSVPLDKKITKEELFDEIMPNADDVSGPLYYLGFVILKTTRIISVDSSGENSLKATIFTTLLQGGTTIIYSIEMIILFIFVVMRVIYIWMFIIFSPLVVLLRCIDKSSKSKNGGEGFWSKITNNINFKSFFWNAFKPTIIVLGFSLAIIFVTLMEGVILSSAERTIDLGGANTFSYKEEGTNNGDRGDQRYTSVIDSNSMGITIAHAGKTLLEFILSIITVILVYHIIKIAVKMGTKDSKDFVTTHIGKLQDTVGDIITKTPILPVTLKDENGNIKLDKNGEPVKGPMSLSKINPFDPSNLLYEKINRKKDEYRDKDSDAVDSFMRFMGLQDDNSLTIKEKNRIESIGRNRRGLGVLEAKRDFIKTISNEGGKGMVLDPRVSDKFWQNQFSDWLSSMKGRTSDISGEYSDAWISMINRWNADANKGNRTLEKMFKENPSGLQRSAMAYATLFGLEGTITTRDDLMKKDISSTDDTGQKKQGEERAESSN